MAVARDVVLGPGVVIHHPDLVNLYGCRIGAETRIGAFVEIQAGAVLGACCKVQSHAFICEGVTLGDAVFVGHGVVFTNDRTPRATGPDGAMLAAGDWSCEPTTVGDRAAIGSNATILPGLRIGADAMIGAGAVVTRNVPEGATVSGNPARWHVP